MLLQYICLSVAALALCRILESLLSKLRDFKRRQKLIHTIPCENRHWLYGNAQNFPPSETGIYRELKLISKYPNCFLKWHGPLNCSVVSYHSDIAKMLLSSNNEPKSEFAYSFLRSWIGDGLLMSHGKKWKRNRRLLTPIFHFDALKRYLPCVNEAAMTMMKKWGSGNCKSRIVEMFYDVSHMTLDNLLRCMLSKHSGCESGENKMYLEAVKCLTEGVAQRLRNPLYHIDFIYFLTSHGKKYQRALKIAHDFTDNAILERTDILKKGTGHRPSNSEYDFLDVLLLAKDENGNGLTHKEIRDELDTFVFEGHDTVTSGISWAFYTLAVYPDLQERCRNEVTEVLNGGHRVDWEHLSKLEYLTKFIKESMRMYSPVMSVWRETNQSKCFPDIFGTPGTSDKQRTFDKKTVFSLKLFLLHRNPTIWKDPEVFDPERFDRENIARRPSHAYLPFSAGSRNCIGQNFAMNEMKAVLAIALSMFKFSVNERCSNTEMKPSLILRSKSGMYVFVEKLSAV